ncbi:ethanolamine utilization protein [Metamycoplasma buccale]|uniref:ethanolamine utilization protein n=1 Tax=Metamycoplasma buccale TaxID=55602 RepID=UPI00398E3141
MKLPTWKDLKFNVKNILWNEMPQTFKEFKERHSRAFSKALGTYLTKINQHNKDMFLKIYQIIFYYGFINFRKELELFNFLIKNGYDVQISNLLNDAIYGIDLIAIKNGVEYLIQVKSNFNNYDLKTMPNLVNNCSKIGVLAVKIGNHWLFKNMLNLEQILF